MPRHNRRQPHRLRPVRQLSERELDTLAGSAARHLAEHAAAIARDPEAATVSGDPDVTWPVFLSAGADFDRLAVALVRADPSGERVSLQG